MKPKNQQDNSKANLDSDTKTRNPHGKSTTTYKFNNTQKYVAVAIIAILVITSVFLCYKYIDGHKQITALTQSNASLQQQVTTINTEINKLNNENSAMQSDYKKQQEKSKLLSNVLSTLKYDINKMQDTDRTQWLVFETEILVNLANQYLRTLKDKKQCLAIIQSASSLLERSDKNKTFYIQEKLNNAIAKLQTITYINSYEIYLKLNFIETIVQDISVSDAINHIKDTTKQLEVVDLSITVNNKSTLYQFFLEKLKLLWNSLKELFIITKRDFNDIYPLPQEQEINTIKLIVYANIEQAKISLLTKQQQIFNESIRKVKQHLRYLPSSNTKLHDELDLLSKIDFSLSGGDVLSEVLSALVQFNTEVNVTDKSSNSEQDKLTNSKESN